MKEYEREMSDIVYADDDAGMRQMVSAVLRSGGFEPRLATNGLEALVAIRERRPDLVILDYRMGKPDGLEVCRTLKDDPRSEHIPVLILTGQTETESRLAGFDAGANDYLAKPFDARELLARVKALLRLTRQGLDRNPTSSLPGGDAIQREYARRADSGDLQALCYFDLDHFKAFGDRFGFTTADALIRDTASALATAASEKADFVGHVGGDDFLMICAPGEARATVERAQRLFMTALEEHIPPEVLSNGTFIGVDREGRERDIPLTRLTAAILFVDPAEFPSLSELGERIARAKSAAKLVSSGVLEVEVSREAEGAAARSDTVSS